MQEADSSRPRRTPWLERGVFLAVIVALALWLAYDRLMAVPHAIVVDGKRVATLESRGDAKYVLEEVRRRQLHGKRLESPTFAQHVSLRRTPGHPEISATEDVISTLDEMLVLKAEGYAIIVDDKPITALATEQNANKTLDLLKDKYAQRFKSLYSKPAFKEDVIVDRRYLPVGNIVATPDEAVEYLTTIHDKPTYHTLKQGDRAVYITAQYGISLQELKSLNPGMDVGRLTEGDQLLVRRPKQPVTVVLKALITKIAPVKSPAERGMPAKTGKRQTWAVVTYENGHEVGQEAIRVMTTWDKPVTPPKPTYTRSNYGGKRYYHHYSYQRSGSESAR